MKEIIYNPNHLEEKDVTDYVTRIKALIINEKFQKKQVLNQRKKK